MARKLTHIHQFRRHNYKNGEQIYFCVLDCNFKVNVKLALGKQNICWICGKAFVLNEYSIRLAKPRCNNCRNVKIDKETKQLVFPEKPEFSVDSLNLDLPVLNLPDVKAPNYEDLGTNPLDDLRRRLSEGTRTNFVPKPNDGNDNIDNIDSSNTDILEDKEDIL